MSFTQEPLVGLMIILVGNHPSASCNIVLALEPLSCTLHHFSQQNYKGRKKVSTMQDFPTVSGGFGAARMIEADCSGDHGFGASFHHGPDVPPKEGWGAGGGGGGGGVWREKTTSALVGEMVTQGRSFFQSWQARCPTPRF